MPYYLVENFNNGLDLRKSPEVAPPGSLRVLRNAFVNEGGEIEKRKAFYKEPTLTAYGQTSSYKGRITGPHEVPGYPDSVFFKHRHDSLPGGAFSAGSGSVAEQYSIGSGLREKTFWAMKSTESLSNFGALFCAASYSEFSNKGYVVEQYVDSVTGEYTQDHEFVTFTSGEPTSEVAVTANIDRAAQMVLKNKGYVIDGEVLYASAVGDPSDMAGTGSGAVNVSTNGLPIGEAKALADYFGQLAIFGRRAVQFYSVDADFAQNQYLRTVKASIAAGRSVTGYGDGDIIFLGRSGIRSLQARDSSNLAAISDIGSPIDRLIEAEIIEAVEEEEPIFSPAAADRPLSDFLDLASGIVNLDRGEFWMFLKDKVFVLSQHRGAKVSAWSTFDLPRHSAANDSPLSGISKSQWAADVAQIGGTICYRNFADEIYLYGGTDGQMYDDTLVEVTLPFMDFGRPGDVKYFTGIDLVCFGEWRVEACVDPEPDGSSLHWEHVATINNSTRHFSRISFGSQGMQIALRFTTQSRFAARISQVAIYYEEGAQK